MTEQNNSRCDICRESFPEHELTGTKIGIWFVICCEPCRKENEREKDTTQPSCVIEIIDPERSVRGAISTPNITPQSSSLQDRQGQLF